MDRICIGLQEMCGTAHAVIDGTTFRDVALVTLVINGTDTRNMAVFADGLIVPEELERSAYKSGRYLIFTSVNGVADDGGWNPVDVRVSEDSVGWRFVRDSIPHMWCFARFEYSEQTSELHELLAKTKLPIEPRYVIQPA